MTIQSIPSEIWGEIAQHLTPDSLLNLRLVDRELKEKITPFVKACLKQIIEECNFSYPKGSPLQDRGIKELLGYVRESIMGDEMPNLPIPELIEGIIEAKRNATLSSDAVKPGPEGPGFTASEDKEEKPNSFFPQFSLLPSNWPSL